MSGIELSLRKKIESTFSPLVLEVENESHMHSRGGDETHFKMVIVSSKFEGMSRVDRQRQVMALFDDERSRGLHALSLRTMTPAEWDKVKDSFEMTSPQCHTSAKAKNLLKS